MQDPVRSRYARTPSSVMPGLVPGISVGAIAEAEMDARNKFLENLTFSFIFNRLA